MKQLVCHQRATKIFIRAAWIVRSGQNDAAACVICPYHRLPLEREKNTQPQTAGSPVLWQQRAQYFKTYRECGRGKQPVGAHVKMLDAIRRSHLNDGLDSYVIVEPSVTPEHEGGACAGQVT